VDHVLGFLEFAGCFLLWVTFWVILRAVAHAKRPDGKLVVERHGPALGRAREDDLARSAANTVL